MSLTNLNNTGIIPTSRQRFYRPELDCLRFFAFLGVFIFHIFPSEPSFYNERGIPLGKLLGSVARAGSFGVDLFFLLSAYLITELLLKEKEEFGSVHLRAFYARRILRIWPLYFFAILVAALLPFVDSTQSFPWPYVVTFLLLSGNWMTSLKGFPDSVMNPLWSISFEEQFYLVWPAIIARSRRTRTLILAAAALVVISEISRLVLFRFDFRGSEIMIFTNTLARLDPLAFGIVTAVVMRHRHFRPGHWLRFGTLALGLLVWITCGHYFHVNQIFLLVGCPAIALGAWLIVMSVFGIGKAPGWLRYLGKISYGLYVFHMLSLYLVDKVQGGYAGSWPKLMAHFWVGLGLTVGLAAISYRFLETPFLHFKERFAYVRSRPV